MIFTPGIALIISIATLIAFKNPLIVFSANPIIAFTVPLIALLNTSPIVFAIFPINSQILLNIFLIVFHTI